MYENLYIYYLDGNVTADRSAFGKGFIGNWQEGDCAFLFFDEPADDRIDALVAESDALILKDRFFMTYEEWIGGARRPFPAGGFLVVPPPWPDKGAPGEKEIRLDPGVVFGSGLHPTTRDCMEALEIVFSSTPVSATIDIGSGTGLLSIAAARMGSLRTLAVDSNYLAVETARDNIVSNHLEDRIVAVQGLAADFAEAPADLVIANIHYDVMKALVSGPGLRQKRFVLSGLLRSQAERIEDDLRHEGAVIEHRWVGEGIWYTMAGRGRL